MIPRLQAEETLAAVAATALGAGSLKPAEAQRITRALQRQAGGARRAAPADPRALSMMGIGVEIVPPSPLPRPEEGAPAPVSNEGETLTPDTRHLEPDHG